MSDQWYYVHEGQEIGPVTSQQLKQVAASGSLQPNDQVRKQNMPSWVPASRVKGLFPPPGQRRTPPAIPTPEAHEPAPEAASTGKEEPSEEYALAEAVSGGGETKEASKPADEAPLLCDRCGDSLRQVLLKREPTDKKLCVTCQPPNGTCPLCRKKLRTPTAQQCMHCGASWHRKVGEKVPSFAPAASGRKSGSQTAKPQKETLGQKAADFVVAAVVDAILSNL